MTWTRPRRCHGSRRSPMPFSWQRSGAVTSAQPRPSCGGWPKSSGSCWMRQASRLASRRAGACISRALLLRRGCTSSVSPSASSPGPHAGDDNKALGAAGTPVPVSLPLDYQLLHGAGSRRMTEVASAGRPREPGRPWSVACGARNGSIGELSLFRHRAEQETPATHVAATDEDRREEQPLPEHVQERLDVPRAGHAAEEDDPALSGEKPQRLCVPPE